MIIKKQCKKPFRIPSSAVNTDTNIWSSFISKPFWMKPSTTQKYLPHKHIQKSKMTFAQPYPQRMNLKTDLAQQWKTFALLSSSLFNLQVKPSLPQRRNVNQNQGGAASCWFRARTKVVRGSCVRVKAVGCEYVGCVIGCTIQLT